MIQRMRDRYAARLRELTPIEARQDRWTLAKVRGQGLAVLVILDLNDWLITRFAGDLPPRLDPRELPWADQVAAQWPQMKREVERYLERLVIPDTISVNGFEPGSDEANASVPTDVGIWRSLILQWFGEDIDENARHFPSIMAAVGHLGVTSFGLTALDARSHIAPHEGPNRGAIRYQLPIIVPGPPGACRIRVADEMIPWEEGRPVVFDLFVNHEVWNDTDEVRVLLMLELPRPLRFPWSVSNRFAQRMYRYFPPFRGLPERVRRMAAEQERELAGA